MFHGLTAAGAAGSPGTRRPAAASRSAPFAAGDDGPDQVADRRHRPGADHRGRPVDLWSLVRGPALHPPAAAPAVLAGPSSSARAPPRARRRGARARSSARCATSSSADAASRADPGRDLVRLERAGQRGRLGAVLVGVAEHADDVEPRGPRKCTSSSTSASVSPGKPTMTLHRTPASGRQLADSAEQVEEALGAAEAAHPAQQRRAGVLEAQVEVRRDARGRRHRLDQRRAGSRPAAGRTPGPGRRRRPARARGSSVSSSRRSPRSLPYDVEFSLTRNSSRTPCPASQRGLGEHVRAAGGRRRRRGRTGSRRTRSAGRTRRRSSAARRGRRRAASAPGRRGGPLAGAWPAAGAAGASGSSDAGRAARGCAAAARAGRPAAARRCPGSRRSRGPRRPRAARRRALAVPLGHAPDGDDRGRSGAGRRRAACRSTPAWRLDEAAGVHDDDVGVGRRRRRARSRRTSSRAASSSESTSLRAQPSVTRATLGDAIGSRDTAPRAVSRRAGRPAARRARRASPGRRAPWSPRSVRRLPRLSMQVHQPAGLGEARPAACAAASRWSRTAW